MFRVINEYLAKVNLQADNSIYDRISGYLANVPDIKKYTVTVSSKRYVVDIKLNEYSVENAAKLFNIINSNISYPYSSMHVRFNEGKCVRYRYITCKEDKSAFYCDIILS